MKHIQQAPNVPTGRAADQFRLLKPWGDNFYASAAAASQQGAAPLPLKKLIQILSREDVLKRVLADYHAQMEAYVSDPQYCLTPTVKDAWLNQTKSLGWLWSGTIIAYAGKNEPFGRFVECFENSMGIWFRAVFPVPRKYQGARNAMLIVEPAQYTIGTDGRHKWCGPNKVVIADPRRVALIAGMPSFEQSNTRLFIPDPVHGIPSGESVCSRWVVDKPPEARELERYPGPFVAPVTLHVPSFRVSFAEPMSRNYCRMLVE